MPASEELQQRVTELEGLLRTALERIAQLEKQLALNSRNSSKPPSADPPGTPPKSRTPTGRQRGGQPGHKGTRRELVPVEQAAEIVPVRPDACRHCRGPLVKRADAPTPERHQQVDLPPMAAVVTEYQLQSAYCTACDDWTCASLPAGVPEHGFGPRLSALVALLTGRYRLSKRSAQGLLWDVTGVRLAVGSVSNLEQRVNAALATPVDEALNFVRRQQAVFQDETSWFQSGRLLWLWVTLTSLVTVFHVRSRRSTEVSKSILGEDFAGHLVSDRHNLYCWRDPRLRQLCWSHLLRDFQKMIDFGSGSTKRMGHALLRQGRRLFRLWRRLKEGHTTRPHFLRSMVDLRKKMKILLRRAGRTLPGCWGSMPRRLLQLWPALWNFIEIEGLEPSNNPAERAIRHAVIWRKTSFGTNSSRGTLFVERILTVVTTLRQQNRPVLPFLVDAYASHLRNKPAPSLLPASC